MKKFKKVWKEKLKMFIPDTEQATIMAVNIILKTLKIANNELGIVSYPFKSAELFEVSRNI